MSLVRLCRIVRGRRSFRSWLAARVSVSLIFSAPACRHLLIIRYADCTSVDEIGEPFIELGDGTHFGLGVGTLGKFTADELQEHLEASGKERLGAEQIENLIQLKVIRFLI